MRMLFLFVFCAACSEQTVGKRNQAPTAEITSHESGVELSEETVVFSGQVSDLNHQLSTLRVNWYANDNLQCESRVPNEMGRSSCAIDLHAEHRTIRMEVRDPDQEYGDNSIEINVTDPLPPTIQIHSPSPNERYTTDEWISFHAYVDDPDGDTAEIDAIWQSNRDGLLDHLNTEPDSNGQIHDVTTLSVGQHNITLTAIDSRGLETSESRIIQVDAENQPPVCDITFPEDPAEATSVELIVLQATVSDPDTEATTIGVLWESSIDGVLGGTPPDSSGLAQLPVQGLSIGAHIIKLTTTDDKDENCIDQLILNIIPGDGPPSQPTIEITPNAPITEFDDLHCQITQASEDPEGQLVQYAFSWYRNGVLWSGSTLNLNHIGDGISVSETLSGETWACEVIASDGIFQSVPVLSSVITQSCAEYRDANSPHTYGSTVDPRDGQSYRTLQIGAQLWMVDNLNIGLQINSGNLSANNGQIEKYCIDDNPIRCAEFGGLYSRGESIAWSDPVSANGIQGICPPGWHVATKSDFESILGMAPSNTDLIDLCEGGGIGEDTLGFSARMAGRMAFGQFTDQGQQALYWTSTWSGGQYSHHLPIVNNTNAPSPFGSGLDPLQNALSIRCVAD